MPANPDPDLPAGFRHRQITVGGSSLHVVEAGDPAAPPVLLVHGWPQTSYSWRHVMTAGASDAHLIALDLPGIGDSRGDPTDGSKQQLAATIHQLVDTMGLENLTLVGHDAGALVVYAYLRSYALHGAVLMDAPIPGVDPWDELMRNPQVWHFALHALPSLPERLVRGRQRDYFGFFFDNFSRDPAAVTDDARTAYANAYASDEALTAGFNWYRTLAADASTNREADNQQAVATPVLNLRADQPGADPAPFLDGLHRTGLSNVEQTVVTGAGHFLQEEAPDQVWQLIADFAGIRDRQQPRTTS